MLSEVLEASLPLVLKASITIFGLWVLKGLNKLIKTRRRFLQLEKDGFPMPPYHPIWGHLPLAFKIRSSLPPQAHNHYLVTEIFRMYPDMGRMFYFDTSPFAQPILFINTPESAHLINQEYTVPKSDFIRYYMNPLTECKDLVVLESAEWKQWRSIFNPGFSPSHLLTLVPSMVEDVQKFAAILKKHAEEKDLLLLDTLTINLAIDVIGRAAMNENFDTQTKPHAMVTALRKQIETLAIPNEAESIKRFNFLRIYKRWGNESIMKKWFSEKLQGQASRLTKEESKTQKRTIMDLALEQYVKEFPGATGLDDTFAQFASSQLKIFIFAGHDTTSSVICYFFYLLEQNPEAHKKMCAEHDEVFGTDADAAASIISSNPSLLNALPYTLAALKETLRLVPPANAFRQNDGSVPIKDIEGRLYPSEGCMLWTCHIALHRDPLYWKQPNDFLPERWLVSPGDPLYPVKDAWRPFELGARSCIGQTLATLEIKIVMVLTARTLQVKSAYEEFDKLHPSKGARVVNGERAYQIQVGSSAPADHFPARIYLRGK